MSPGGDIMLKVMMNCRGSTVGSFQTQTGGGRNPKMTVVRSSSFIDMVIISG